MSGWRRERGSVRTSHTSNGSELLANVRAAPSHAIAAARRSPSLALDCVGHRSRSRLSKLTTMLSRRSMDCMAMPKSARGGPMTTCIVAPYPDSTRSWRIALQCLQARRRFATVSFPPWLNGMMWSSSVAVMEQPGMPSQQQLPHVAMTFDLMRGSTVCLLMPSCLSLVG